MNLFFASIAIGVGVLAFYYLVCGLKKPSKQKKPAAAPSAAYTPPVSRPPKEYTLEEVAKHNNRDDLWLVVEGRVYDVTKFVSVHPGGDAILKYPGQDNTSTFFHDQHPETVRDQLSEYFIGTVKK